MQRVTEVIEYHQRTETPSFTVFAEAVTQRFAQLSRGELYTVQADDLFEQYLAAFPPGTNPMFRTRTEYDCQSCKQFIRRLGVVVAITDGAVVSVWSGLDLPDPFATVAAALGAYVTSLPIASVFRTKECAYGVTHNYDPKTEQKYHHFHGAVSARHLTDDAATQRGEKQATFDVFRRGLVEITAGDMDAVLDLIASNALYRGEEHKAAVAAFRQLRQGYDAANRSDLYVWEHLNDRNARFRNTVIGTLLVDLADGKDLEAAVKSFEAKVAPANYKRPSALITQRMVEEATQTLTTLGLGGAIYRRYARFSDVSVNDVLFVDNATQGKMKDGIAGLLAGSIQKPAPNVVRATAISGEDFVRRVLPSATSVAVLVENRHLGNFVSLTGSDGPERIFKWDNNFAWSYDGDVADSVKQRVKKAGGNINADIRVSLSWYNFDDLDLHALLPNGTHVYYGNKYGVLDVDMNAGHGSTKTPVENLAFMRPADGVYKVFVHQFRQRERDDIGFSIEIESAGVVRIFAYDKVVRDQDNIPCFDFTVKAGKLHSVAASLTEGSSSQSKWGVETETLVPVTSIMRSPNHWGANAVGAKHLILALQSCNNPEPTRGVYNEFLRGEFERHRKVFEVLGSKTKCAPTGDQISGLGFTAARNDSVTVVVNNHSTYTINF